jgi:hypothetical protein
MAKFRVLHGIHAEGGQVYRAGEVVDSATDLNRMNTPGSSKFEELVGGGVAVVEAATPSSSSLDDDSDGAVNDELDTMTVSQLREFAAQEEISLESSKKKADIVAAIRSAIGT